MKIFLGFVFTLILFLSFDGLGQEISPDYVPVLKASTKFDTSQDYTVGEVRGAVKTTAVYLAKPQYPDEARWAGAEGKVRVQIAIDDQGNVTKAEMISGDERLRLTTEDAARRSKFRILRDAAGKAVNIDGVLVYSFTINPAGWSQIGYGLNSMGRLPFSFFSIPMAKKAIPIDWKDESLMFDKLYEIQRNSPPILKPSVIRLSVQTHSNQQTINGTMSAASVARGQVVLPTPPAGEQIAISENLISALQSRLAGDELKLWQFELGLNLSKAFETYLDPNERLNAIAIIRKFIETEPANAPPEVVEALRNIKTLLGKAPNNKETGDSFRDSMYVILRSR